MATTPKGVSDAFIHAKNGSKTERIILPFTRYRNILNAPKLVTTPVEAKGRRFSLYQTETEEVSSEDVTALLGVSL